MANKYITKELLAKHKGINLDRIFQYSDLDLKEKYKKYASNLKGHKLKLYLRSFDRAIGGIRPGQLCTVIMPVNTGKTTLGLNICYNQVKDKNSIRANGKLVVFLGMETSDYELYERMIQMEFGIDTEEIEKKYDESRGCDEEFIGRVDEISKNWDGIVNVVYRINMHEIIPYISALKEVFNKDIGALIVDYLGLIKHPTSKGDYQKITDVMQELKELALSHMIPVLNFSTTGREEAKDKKKPLSLFSGKGSGEIEGSSQIVITMERVKELEGRVTDDVVKAVQRQETDILEATIHKKKQGKYAKILVELNKKNLLMSEYNLPPVIQEGGKPF